MFRVVGECLVLCGDKIKMLGDMGCIDYYQFFNGTFIGYQLFTSSRLILNVGNVMEFSA